MEYKVKGLSDYSEKNLIGEHQRIAKLLNKNTLMRREFDNHVKAGSSVLIKRFCSWNNSLIKAGLTPYYLFKEHNHNPSECNLIVCWEHDWKDCPLEVISLKEIYKKFDKKAEI